MGNDFTSIDATDEREEIYSHHYVKPTDSDEDRRIAKIDPEKKEQQTPLYLRQSRHYFHNFTNKWLSQFALRRIVVTNKLHGMDTASANISKKFNRLIKRFDYMIIHHCGIEIILNGDGCMGHPETYIIFPDYAKIVTDWCLSNECYNIREFEWNIGCMIPRALVTKDESDCKSGDFNCFISDDSECHLYGKNYGYIDHVYQWESSTYKTINVSNEGIYDKLLFQNKEFMCKSILPIDILKIIFNEYIGDTHREGFSQLIISNVEINDTEYGWICHKLKHANGEQEKITFRTTINIFGKYFNLETVLNIDYYEGRLSELAVSAGRYYYKEFRAFDKVIGEIVFTAYA